MLSAEEYRQAFEAAPDGFIVVDDEGIVRDANAQVERLFGWPRDELLGQAVEVLVPVELRDSHVAHRGEYAAQPRARPMGIGLELLGRRRDGTVFPIEISLSPCGVGDIRRTMCIVRDVTERRRLRTFSEGSLRAAEEERQRISRELHDDTAQRLAALILRVRGLSLIEDAADRQALFEVVREELIETAEGVKRIARGLRPPELEEVGLEAAVQAHARNVRERTGFEVLTDIDPVRGLDLNGKLVLYRIVQEALSNARRHSGAPRAEVRVGMLDGVVVAEISDRGRGFVAARVSEPGAGLGLVGMQERAAMIGGRLIIESRPAKGTVVRLEVPVRKEVAQGV